MSQRLKGLAVIGAMLLAGCGGGHHREVQAPSQRVDSYECTPPEFPDAVPKREPLSRYGNPETYKVFGVSYHVMKSGRGYRERGIASWYGPDFHGKRTSSGEQYNMHQMTAAHKTLPLPSYVLVTNLDNNRQAVVRVNDRGPFHEDRIIDLSYAAAQKLCVVRNGTARVEVEALDPDTYTGRLVASTGSARSAEVSSPESDSGTAIERPQSGGLDDATGVAIPSAAAATTVLSDNSNESEQSQEQASAADSSPTPALPPGQQTGGFISEGEQSESIDPNLRQVGSPKSVPDAAGDDVLLQTPTMAPAGGSLYLQAGAFSQRANAEALADRLRKSGLTQVRISTPPAEPEGPFRVRLGPYSDADTLETDRQRLDELDIMARSVRE